MARPVMEYDTPPRADHVSRRKFHLVLVLALVFGAAVAVGLLVLVLRLARSGSVVTVAPVATPARPAAVRVPVATPARSASTIRREANEAQLRQLLTQRPLPTQVVYEEDPVAARKLFGQGVCNAQAARRNMAQPYFGAFEPPVFRTDGFLKQSSSSQPDALLFAGPLTSPGGNVRLVLLEMDVNLDGTKLPNDEYKVAIDRQLKYRICEPRVLGDGPQTIRWGTSLKILQTGERNIIPIKWVDGTLRADRPSEYNLRFFAGQSNPNDRSHFTIDYELAGTKSKIDCHLTDDDFLRVLPRSGVVDKGEWRIDAAQ